MGTSLFGPGLGLLTTLAIAAHPPLLLAADDNDLAAPAVATGAPLVEGPVEGPVRTAEEKAIDTMTVESPTASPPSAAGAAAIDPPAVETATAGAALAATSGAPAGCCRIAAGTTVALALSEAVASSRNQRGDRFRLELAEPIEDGSRTLILAGTPGFGEVVHADAARGGGAPGELLLAARYLEHACGRIPLRGFKLGGTGKDNSGIAMGVSIGAGPFAMFIRGREIEIPAGTYATAKLASDLVIRPDDGCLKTLEHPTGEPVALPPME